MLGALHITRWMISKVVGYTLGIMYPAFMSFKSLESASAYIGIGRAGMPHRIACPNTCFTGRASPWADQPAGAAQRATQRRPGSG
jgi:hypothetical protein